jgi:hypothetical protein
MKTYILDFGIRWERMVSFTRQPFYHGEIFSGAHWIGDTTGQTWMLWSAEESLPSSGNRTLAIQPVSFPYSELAIPALRIRVDLKILRLLAQRKVAMLPMLVT